MTCTQNIYNLLRRRENLQVLLKIVHNFSHADQTNTDAMDLIFFLTLSIILSIVYHFKGFFQLE